MAGKLLNTQQAAELLGLSPRTLEAMRAQDRGPRYIRVTRGGRRGGTIRYRLAALEAWIAAHEVEPREAAAAGR